MFWTITGWLIALASLLVNIMQLIQNKKLKKSMNSMQNIGEKASGIQQTHSGHGDNINVGGNVEIDKK